VVLVVLLKVAVVEVEDIEQIIQALLLEVYQLVLPVILLL
jgi:hypothetical protein|tara:strand:- start:598 stop:717 length:120 start_codon:yes stop_codon:yes gene_type:complete